MLSLYYPLFSRYYLWLSHDYDITSASDAVSMPFTDLPPKLLAERRCKLRKGLATVERQAPLREQGSSTGKVGKIGEQKRKNWVKHGR